MDNIQDHRPAESAWVSDELRHSLVAVNRHYPVRRAIRKDFLPHGDGQYPVSSLNQKSSLRHRMKVHLDGLGDRPHRTKGCLVRAMPTKGIGLIHLGGELGML